MTECDQLIDGYVAEADANPLQRYHRRLARALRLPWTPRDGPDLARVAVLRSRRLSQRELDLIFPVALTAILDGQSNLRCIYLHISDVV